jgi:hypothetical protein
MEVYVVETVLEPCDADARGQRDEYHAEQHAIHHVRKRFGHRGEEQERRRVHEPLHLLALDPARPPVAHHYGRARTHHACQQETGQHASYGQVLYESQTFDPYRVGDLVTGSLVHGEGAGTPLAVK